MEVGRWAKSRNDIIHMPPGGMDPERFHRTNCDGIYIHALLDGDT